MRAIYRKICHARYLYIKRNVEKVWGARYKLGARYLSKNTVHCLSLFVLIGNFCRASLLITSILPAGDILTTSLMSKHAVII